MCRRSVDAILLALALTASLAATLRADDVAEWLERRGLAALLATRLEQELDENRDPQRRQQLAARLAAVYARLLESGGDPATLADLEARSRALLGAVAGQDADELRIALLGATQRSAAKVAERRRLRAEGAEELVAAQATLERILPELREVRKQIRHGLDGLQRRLSRAGGVEATILVEEVECQQRLAAQASFLAAWTAYYLGWLDGRQDLIREADALFVELLDTGEGNPSPADISTDLRAQEPYARAILGVALCRALSQRTASALDWLALLADASTYSGLRSELPAWRLAILLDAGEWEQATQELAKVTAEPSAPTAWMRLAAARGLESAQQSAAARRLAGQAVAELARRGELSQVLDLARRFGIEALGEQGFVLRYVRGVERFDAARASHAAVVADVESPLNPSSQHAKPIELYEQSARELEAGLREPDAASFAPAAAAAQAMIGWCRYYQGRLVDASTAFAAAATRQEGGDAAESLWMAIVTIDRLRGAGNSTPELDSRLDELVAKFLAEHPSSARAPHLVLRRARGDQPATLELAEQLQAVPPNSDAFPEAQRRTVQVLYELYRGARGADRLTLARRLLAAAAPVIDGDVRQLDALADTQREAHVLRVRQTIEAALDSGVGRHELARERLAELSTASDAGLLDLAPIAEELAFRRMQVHLAADERADAERMARELVAATGDGPWRRAVARAMFRDAFERWRGGGPSAIDDAAAQAQVVEWGSMVLAEVDLAPDAATRRQLLEAPAMLATLAAVAEAAARRWEATRDETMGRTAASRLDAVLTLRPNDSTALRFGAIVAHGLGQSSVALDRLRALLAGTPVGSTGWFEAKHRQISILAETDAPRAREVMDQLKSFHPDFGPAPWGERLRALDFKIPLTTAVAPERRDTGAGP